MSIDINGIAYSWHDEEISFRAEGGIATVITRLSALNWGHGVVIENIYGTERVPVDQVVAHYELDDLAVTFQKKGWERFKAAAPTRWMGLAVTITVKYKNKDEPLRTTEVQCRLMKETESNSQGGDATAVEVTGKPSLIKTNGQVVYPE